MEKHLDHSLATNLYFNLFWIRIHPMQSETIMFNWQLLLVDKLEW